RAARWVGWRRRVERTRGRRLLAAQVLGKEALRVQIVIDEIGIASDADFRQLKRRIFGMGRFPDVGEAGFETLDGARASCRFGFVRILYRVGCSIRTGNGFKIFVDTCRLQSFYDLRSLAGRERPIKGAVEFFGRRNLGQRTRLIERLCRLVSEGICLESRVADGAVARRRPLSLLNLVRLARRSARAGLERLPVLLVLMKKDVLREMQVLSQRKVFGIGRYCGIR